MKRKYQSGQPIGLLSIILASYMLLALIWWGILLWRNNDLIHTLQFQLDNEKREFYHKKQHRNRSKIVGEGLAFAVALLIGIKLIMRSHSREIESIRQKKNFLLAITHELKSPIASISLILETIKKRTLKKEDQHKLVDNGLREKERLLSLIDNLLLSARLDKSYQPVFEPHDLNQIVRKATESIHGQYPDAVIVTHLNSQPLSGKFDLLGVHSAIFNLIENAIKYRLDNSPVHVFTSIQQEQFLIHIKDHGPGIPEFERKKIFEQFYRAGAEETRKVPGTGLGLYIAKKMIDYHQGKIEITANIPQGSIFTIYLPIDKK